MLKRKQSLPEPNIVVRVIADLLVTQSDSELFGSEYLNANALDYSFQSLTYIDNYLEKVRKNRKKFDEIQYSVVILRCGAYTGEVIRRQINDFHWVMYDEAVKRNTFLSKYPQSLVTLYLLEQKKSDTILFPMAKVDKFVINGKEDSLHFYVATIIKNYA